MRTNCKFHQNLKRKFRGSLSKESLFYKIPTAIGDLAIHIGTLCFLIFGTGMVREVNLPRYLNEGTFLLMVFSYLVTVAILGIHINDRSRSAVKTAFTSFLSAFLVWMLFNGSIAIIYEVTLQGKLITLQLAISAAGIILWHLLLRFIIARLREKGLNHFQVVLVGTGEKLDELFGYMRSTKAEKGFEVMGVFTENESDHLPEGAKHLGCLDKIPSYLKETHPMALYCALSPETKHQEVTAIIGECEKQMVRFKFVPSMEGYPPRKLAIETIGSVNVLSLFDEPLNNPGARIVKRIMDILVSGLFLVTLYPFVWLFCAIGIKISSPKGPILFRQKRTGYEGAEFDCLKFRSMHPSSDADTKQATKDDNRVFRFGKFLRRSSLDELPQFINVFRGDMSIVGPRPHMLYHTDVYSDLISDYMVRHLAKPGITGWAQVNGCRGETKELSQMKARVEKDIWYIENWSVDLDISIFFITIWQILTRKSDMAY